MLLPVFLVLVGLAVLLLAADWLVDGAERFAGRMHIPKAVVGLTIVAFGTSLPELVVAARATLSGLGGLALGNVIGSNIANVLLVLGAVGLASPFHIASRAQHHAHFVLAAVTVAFTAILLVDALSFAIGVAAWLLLLGFVYGEMRRGSPGGDEDVDLPQSPGVIRIIAGIVGVAIGAELLVRNAAELTAQYMVRDEFIGLTVIAVGTSLPELATVYASIRRKAPDIAIGNIVGSNIFNILAVGGAVGLLGGADLSTIGKVIDLPSMVLATVLLFFFVMHAKRLSRAMALVFLSAFFGYLWLITATASG